MKEERRHVIVAPHADDEIIGCYEVLSQGSVWMVAFPRANPEALEESVRSSHVFGFSTVLVDGLADLASLANVCQDKGGLIFFPDPFTELHPVHRRYGAMGLQIRKNVAFYTTNMNSPYMHESNNPFKKKTFLDTCYADKRDLWRYDHKYYLFEGCIKCDIHDLI